MFTSKKMLFLVAILTLASVTAYVEGKSSTKTMQTDKKKSSKKTKKKAKTKTFIRDPILREYTAKLNDKRARTYTEPGSKIPKLHTKEQYLNKNINELTKKLFDRMMHIKQKEDIQKRIRALRELKKNLR